MRFRSLAIAGLHLVEMEWRNDERGGFTRAFCAREFSGQGIAFDAVQANISRNRDAGTGRGMHYQDLRAPEAKMVRCVASQIFDVVLDLRKGSPTFGRWEGIELPAAAGNALYVPAGVAHGFQALVSNCDVHYTMGAFYQAEMQRGVRWNDPAFAIRWPLEVTAISERDAAFADYAS